MTESQLREMIIWRVQSVLPEVVDWNTMLRVLRIAKKGINPERLSEHANDPAGYYIPMVLQRYGEVTQLYYDEIEIQWLASDRALLYRNYGVLSPAFVSWRSASSDEYRPLNKIFRFPVRKKVALETGTPDAWLLQGLSLVLVPRPGVNGYVLVEGALAPYIDINQTNKPIIGVEPTDLPYIAQHIASYFIEGTHPQHALMWRQEAEQMYLRRLKDTKWYQHRQRRGVRYGER